MNANEKKAEAPPEYLTSGQVVARLGVSRQTISNLVKSGELKAIRLKRKFRFERDAFERWIKDREQAA
jgi:excisionase family DNA binding protein